MPTRHIINALCLFCSLSLFAQEGFLNGVLLDVKTQEPIPFATIRIQGYALGVISNMDGGFKIPEKFQSYGDTLEISCMGYHKKEVLVSDLYKGMVNRIRLVPKVFELQETIVTAPKRKKLSPRAIVRKAIKAIPENFPLTSFSTIGYYRDYQLKNQQYVNLNEAILNVFDRGFDEFDQETSKVKIYEYRQNMSFLRDTIAQQPYNYLSGQKIIDTNTFLYDYGGNEFTILRIHDAIRNHNTNTFSYVNRLRYDLLGNHNFLRTNDVYLDDEVLYRINFSKLSYPYIASGSIFISKRDFAIHKMEYAVHRRVAESNSTAKGPSGQDQRLIFRVLSEYQRHNNKMYLNYVSFNNRFEVQRPSEFFVKEVEVNKNQKVFIIDFSKEVDEKGVYNEGNYKFVYKGKKVRFKKVVLTGNKLMLFPKVESAKDAQIFREICVMSTKEGIADPASLMIKIDGIVDVDGHRLNQLKKEEYDQFREFFVQQLRPNMDAPETSLFMDKNKPIFTDQPIDKPANFDDYWMNTPLKKVTAKLNNTTMMTSNAGN